MLPAATVGELITQLVTRYTDLRRHLYTDDGKLRSFVNVYVNDEDIRYLDKENTPVKENDVVSIVPSIAGGLGCRSLEHSVQPSGFRRWEPRAEARGLNQTILGPVVGPPGWTQGCRGRAVLHRRRCPRRQVPLGSVRE